MSTPGLTPIHIRVLLVEDHELVRKGTRQVLNRDSRIKVVGEADCSEEAIRLLGELQPDVVILDIRLAKGSGLDVLLEQPKIAPKCKALVLSAYDDDCYIRPLLKRGARGYLMKSVSARDLRQAVRDVAEGKLVFKESIADKVLQIVQDGGEPTKKHDMVNNNLSDRESQVLKWITDGLTNRQIAVALGISMKTVETHIQKVFLKLGVTSRTQAVMSAHRDSYVA